MAILAGKAGIYGMIGGQTADTEAEELPEEQVTQELLLFIHENKTAALIQSSMMIGEMCIRDSPGNDHHPSPQKGGYGTYRSCGK